MRRYLCVWLTDWPIDRLRRQAPAGLPAPGEPFALTASGARGLRVVAACPAARAQGVVPGLGLADARARLPALRSLPHDPAADAAALLALAGWADRWSPLVAVDGTDGLRLDITGCAHLWGGETGLAADVSGRLGRAGLAHRLGIAATPGAAWALAHAAPGPVTVLDGGGEAALRAGLAELPVAGLRLDAPTLALLRRFGLTRIGAVAGLDRAALARRFAAPEPAAQVVLRLDQALGRVAEPLVPLRAPPDHAARLPCPEPLTHPEGVRAGLARLAGRLCDGLAAAGQGGRRFRLAAYRADGTAGALEVAAALPVRAPDHLMRLFGERLGRLDPGHGIDLMILRAEAVAPLREAAPPLGPGLAASPVEAEALARLADRIAARLGGPETVQVALPRESHLPERAEELRPFDGTLPGWLAALRGPGGGAGGRSDGMPFGGAPGLRDPDPRAPGAPRPLRLFERPEPVEVLAALPDGPPARFVWRRVARTVVRAEGPERIGPEWWRADPGPSGQAPRTRDYYRVEDGEGRRYWLCREGLYGDGRDTPPRWFLHGLFG